MHLRNAGFCMIAAILLVVAGGCKKSASEGEASASPASLAGSDGASTIARIHWLGKKRIGVDTNSLLLMATWNLSESSRLESRTLDKLASAPWRCSSLSNSPLALAKQSAPNPLRPILDDLVQKEWFIEVVGSSNVAPEIALAIHMDTTRAAIWRTNLPLAVESLFGQGNASGTGADWSVFLTNSVPLFRREASGTRLEMVQVGDWTLVGAGGQTNRALKGIAKQIGDGRVPFHLSETNFWFEAQVDLKGFGALSGGIHQPAADLPIVGLGVFGDGQSVRTRGSLTYAHSLDLKLDPWQVPTNFIRRNLISLAAARGVQSLLGGLGLFAGMPSNAVPTQAFVWDQAGAPIDTFFALAVEDAHAAFSHVAPILRDWIMPRLAPDGGFLQITNGTRLEWLSLPLAVPFFREATNGGTPYLLGGFNFHIPTRTNQIPPELLQYIAEGTNLVYYEWESTKDRINHWRYVDDASHVLLDAAHIARFDMEFASAKWIVAAFSNLDYTATEVRLVDTNQLSFARRSSTGFNAMELEALINWLEMPQFPYGLHSLIETNTTPATPLKRQRAKPVH